MVSKPRKCPHFCSQFCKKEYSRNSLLKEWKEKPEKFNRIMQLRGIKQYILDKQNNACAICGQNSEWNNMPLTLVLDHIDGNAANNCEENLRCVCPNCDSQLSTFKSKNKHSARRRHNYYVNDPDEIKKAREERARKKEEKEKQKNEERNYTRQHGMKQKVKTCKYCGKEYYGRAKYFCSKECSNNSRRLVPDKETLLSVASKSYSMTDMVSKLRINTSYTAVVKWCKKYDIYNEVKKLFLKRSYPVIQYDIDGNFVKEWANCNNIVINGITFVKSCIHKCCNGRKKTYRGYIWRYKKDI